MSSETPMDLRMQLQRAMGDGCRILRELGGGGMSRVFLAEDIEHGREIVIKVIPSELAGQVSVERFRREIKVAAKLQHPCIVPVLSSGSADGLPYYVMPFVEGESLRSRLSREKGLPVADVTRILRDVASALAYAHEHDVVHRDIKPDNILVTKHHAVLLDFGVAKAITESAVGGKLTSIGIALGTPAYMAPEQATADPSTDHRADLYALGAVAYEMLAGRHPFEGRSPQAMLAAHTIEKPVALEAHRPNVPRELGALIMRMLEKHPGDRPQSADEVLAGLDQVPTPGSQAIVAAYAAPASAPALASVQKTRKRLVAASAAGGALLTILAISMFAFGEGFSGRPLPAGNVLVLAPSTTGTKNPGITAVADQILDAVNRGLGQVGTAHVITSADGAPGGPENAASEGRRSGAGKVITTSIYAVGDGVQVQFRLVDANTGDIIRTLTPVRIPKDPTIADLDAAIDPLLTVVGFSTSALLGPETVPVHSIPRFAAFKDFETAVKLGENPDRVTAEEARKHIISAFQRDTTFIQARLWEMWISRSTSAVRNLRSRAYEYDTLQAYVLANRNFMSPFEATMADYVYDRLATEKGVAALKRILKLNPVTPLRRELPGLLADLNRPFAADSAMSAILALDSSLNSNTGFWLVRAGLYHYTGDYRRSLEAARHARKIAPTGMGPLRAELSALAALGDTGNIDKLLEVAAEAGRSRGFFDFAGDLYLYVSQELTAHGHVDAGRRTFDRSLAWFDKRTAADWEDQSIAFRGALGYMVAGRLADADKLLGPLATKYPEDFRYKGAQGRLAVMQGDTAKALRIEQELAALPGARFSGSPAFERAQIMAELNRRDDAISLLREAFGQGVGFASYRARLHTFYNFARMKDYPPFQRIITPNG